MALAMTQSPEDGAAASLAFIGSTNDGRSYAFAFFLAERPTFLSSDAILESCFMAIAGIGNGLRVQPDIADQGAKTLGIDVGVTRRRGDALVSQEGLHVTQVGSAFVEKERGGGMPQGMSRNYRHSSALAGELDAGIESLIAKWRAGPARKD